MTIVVEAIGHLGRERCFHETTVQVHAVMLTRPEKHVEGRSVVLRIARALGRRLGGSSAHGRDLHL